MVVVESIIATAVSGFILKEIARAQIRKRSKNQHGTTSSDGDDEECQSHETPTEDHDSSSPSPPRRGRVAVIEDDMGRVRHAILFDGLVNLDSLTSVEIQQDGSADFRTT